IEEGPFRNHPNIVAGITVHLLMLATMCPYIVFACLTVILTCWIVTELLSFILIKIEFHSRPLSVESHAKKERDYPIRVLISIVPSYTTEARTRAHAFVVMLAYQIIHYLAACWSPFDLTAEEGLHALTTLCLVEVSPHNAPTITVSLRLVTLSRAYCT